MDGEAERCAHCGTPSRTGARFCVNCGAQLGTEPTNPRVFPSTSDPTSDPTTDTAERVYDVAGSGRPGAGLWAGVAAALVVVLLLGGFLVLHGGSDHSDASARHPTTPEASASLHGASDSAGSAGSTPPSPSTASQVTGPPTDVAGFARAGAPRHAPAGVDFAGHRVSYVAANLVDGRNDTCWRTPGDATGTVLTFRLDQPTKLRRVGLVNGYSKIAYSHGRAFDWYRGNRRVRSVQWLFDDGSSVTERLHFDRDLQQIPIKPVTTRVVRLRITAVSKPGKGKAARNDTAISEVLLLGRTG
jgi:hypothetical protein